MRIIQIKGDTDAKGLDATKALYTHHTRRIIMNPYQLRFEIFKQAYSCASDEFHAAFAKAENWNENNSVKMEYPDYPSYEYIEKLANKINNFVSSN